MNNSLENSADTYSIASLEENIFENPQAFESDELVQTPPPSPTALLKKESDEDKPGIFSLAQVSIKLNELWSTARERVFGEDYWIPSDVYDVVVFPPELLKNHRTVFPANARENASLRVVQCVIKEKPDGEKNEDVPILNHVVYYRTVGNQKESLSLFRTEDLGDAMDFYRRCEECRVLLKLLGSVKDIKKPVRDLTTKFQLHPLWKMSHIAIACARLDVFSDEGLEQICKMGYSSRDLYLPIAPPEGKYPIMIAIEMNQIEIVKFLVKIGADLTVRDAAGNTCLHYAALASTQMIDVIWSYPSAKELLNALNNDRMTPVLVAIRNANPFILKLLLNLGAELNLRIAGKNPLFEAVQSKGKTIDVIKAILDAQPDILNEKDEATGNTVLHAATVKLPLMGVLYLHHKDLNLNAKNNAGQTALHLYTTRADIGMIITIASYACDLNVKDMGGNTALHIAATKNYLNIMQLLICLGADPNITNNHGETPRHLAAKLNEPKLLKTLVVGGAHRCSPHKMGCVSGCVNERSVRFLSKSNSLSDAQGAKASPRSLAAIEEIESRRNADEPPWNKLQEREFQMIYDDMLKRLTKMAKDGVPNKNIINILSLDGGGIRGLVIMQILLAIEQTMGEPVFKYFDWVAGTSTGGLVAAGLSQGKTLRECQMIYLRFKDLIFDGWVRPYKSATLEAFVKAEMGEETLMSELHWPRLMFTTTRANVFPVQLEFLRNYRLPLSEEENIEFGFSDPTELQLWKALRRTSAAPTYFSCVDNAYIDGGLISNNPTLDFLAEVQLWNTTCRHLEKYDSVVEVGCLLSIGTGVIPNIPMDATQLDITNNPYSSAVAMKNLGIILVEQVTATEGAPVNRASSWCVTKGTPFFRLSPPLHKNVAMDTRDDEELTRMMWECLEYTYRNQAYIKRLCVLLKAVGLARDRRELFQKPPEPNDPPRSRSHSPPPEILEDQ